MHAEQFRELYLYHFAINQKLWDELISPLSEEQFTQDLAYSVGSVRNQLVHSLETELRWFSGLQNLPLPPYSDPESYPDKDNVRALNDQIKEFVETYLSRLDDDTLNEPLNDAPSKILVWQALQHVLFHGIDHRAQLLAMLNQMGIETFPQDYFLYLFGRI